MLALQQAIEVQQAIIEYLKTTFHFSDAGLNQAFDQLLQSPKQGLFKGPYLQLRMPYEKLPAAKEATLSDHMTIRPPFTPYLHQYKAFKRLSFQQKEPQSVLLTTGTGSGKTESFLFPLLDYCHNQRNKRGIKAIVLYPMNALATDQAQRFAKEIYKWKSTSGKYLLRDRIRVGLFIGEGQSKAKDRSRFMTEDRVIESRQEIVNDPPDILLTNFKMLDFALMKAEHQGLWKYNKQDPGLLKFMVLDELHTYDGAKGSDVAGLMRRLKLKLNMPDDQLVPIGTSATLADSERGKKDLIKFVEEVFGSSTDLSAIIAEQRMPLEDFFSGHMRYPIALEALDIEACRFKEDDSYQSYIQRQIKLWGYQASDEFELAINLKENLYLYELATICAKGSTKINELVQQWRRRLNTDIPAAHLKDIITSLFGLVGYAKEKSGDRKVPFLHLQVSLWMRTVSKIVRLVQETPVFKWEADLSAEDQRHYLPPYFCRECGGSGWLGISKENDNHFSKDITATRSKFMADLDNTLLYCIIPRMDKDIHEIVAADYDPTGDPITGFLSPEDLTYTDKKVDPRFEVLATRKFADRNWDKVCPHCNSRNSLALIGTGLPTLESIAAAQCLMTASTPEASNERKLLIFTNGVQDAAHQAGFVENRNYRFGMRSAIQSVIRTLEDPISLYDLYGMFSLFWRNEYKSQEKDYYYNFLPPDCETRVDVGAFEKADGSFKSIWIEEFERRTSWEVWAEYTYRAILGRTLEKSMASAPYIKSEDLEEVYEQLKYWLDDNQLGDRVLKKDFVRFLHGFLYRLRTKGGVDHPYLKKFRTEKSNYFLITQNLNKSFFLMRNFGKKTRLPRFLTLDNEGFTKTFDIVQTGKADNWFSRYFIRNFPLITNGEKQLINDFYEKLLDYLDANGILDKKVAAGTVNYGLSPSKIFITNEVAALACDQCTREVFVGEPAATHYINMPCLRYNCSGEYKPKKSEQLGYYRMVYNRGMHLRIQAKDHTGLIDRDKREQIESSFKDKTSAGNTNLLLATSTLEMGIDIGDLNVAFNASIPPSTANFLQRIGRAGRSSGTAFILNLAATDIHDLYYYQEPEKMMNGEIIAPACFLAAKDIIRRHFMAYCLDRWAELDPDHHKIPTLVKHLGLKKYSLEDPGIIFTKVSNFIDQNGAEILDLFKLQYEPTAGMASVFEDLKADLITGRFLEEFKQIHPNLLHELKRYQARKKTLKKSLKEMPEGGQEVEDLRRELRNINGTIFNIQRRNVVELMTNLGLLPNYAFPETGVRLNAQLTQRERSEEGFVYNNRDMDEIVRPASSAIKELAPTNVFYSQGVKMNIQGVEVGSEDNYEMYRFCSYCDHLELDVNIGNDTKECPNCGDTSFSSLGNRRSLLKMQAVKSYNDLEKSKIQDDSEHRRLVIYDQSKHIKIDKTTSRGGLILKSIPFGIQFYQQMDFYALNTGVQDMFNKHRIEINGKEHSELGYIVCRFCGKATERVLSENDISYRQSKRELIYHFHYCKFKETHYDPDTIEENESIFKNIYLYRKFTTEGLMILLPIFQFNSDEKVAQFKAGLHLGLKKYYRGHPDHLNIEYKEQYNVDSKQTEKYLVLYDKVPGGSGYIPELFDQKKFTKVLKMAYEQIKNCECQYEQKDGCYECIYTYGNQYERDQLSRASAEQLFEELIEKSGQWESVDSLENHADFSNNEESELEHKFISRLKELGLKEKYEFKEDHRNGRKNYQLILKNESNYVKYNINPQNSGNRLAGVPLNTRPDFIFYPVGGQLDKKDFDLVDIQSMKPIAIYLDGYGYHASERHPKFDSDLKKRKAIIDSHQYHLWVFTWDDLNWSDDQNEFWKDDIGLWKNDRIQKLVLHNLPIFKGRDISIVNGENNYRRFLSLLSLPLKPLKANEWTWMYLIQAQNRPFGLTIKEDVLNKAIEDKRLDQKKIEGNNPKAYNYLDKINLLPEGEIYVFAGLEKVEIKGWYKVESEKSWDKENWQLFWRIFNLIQFHDLEISKVSQRQSDHLEILENFDEGLIPIVEELLKNNIDFNRDKDFSLTENGRIIANAELGVHEWKVFIKPFSESCESKFLENNYEKVDPSKFDITRYLENVKE